ncbi:NAD(P)/FAD-dependent oxidoreductase [Propylenella binzhouense]|uniref:NAD(P)/FAD-dependent oxidoreductase n=1 Tax=Propylenella binzhouense TaxID=2555902 RepID=A0A964T5W1_9HYPH|nr:FAD-dependent oxidoreductase [Propylenella binzhouense]MYZ48467.1 NAD(P)/FAD-dependent oxidoreductase [Propylenella binzhouense]
MTDVYDVVIVGSGHAGAQVALALLQRKFAGSIAILTEEHVLPYERPPLSKEYLTREKPLDRILIRPAAFWAERGVSFRHGFRVVALDPEARRVICASGERVGYGALVWAAGGRPRMLPDLPAPLANVHVLRNVEDADRLMAGLEAAQRVAIVGAGYIGLEVAAAGAVLGKAVTVVEAADRVLARVSGPALSRFLVEEHRARGVDIRLSATLAGIEAGAGRVTALRLSDGARIACDCLIVGIGVAPAVAPLLAAGARGGNGVWVDPFCRTTLPDVFAVGDCALHANPFADGREIRLESVQNATDMAKVAARTLMGDPAPCEEVPWFWSNQYDLRLQSVGLVAGHDTEILRGRPEDRSFSVLYLRDGRLCAADCVNAVKDYVAARRLVAGGTRLDPARLADAATPLKEMIPAAAVC